MSGKPSLRVIDAMLAVVDEGISAHAAALRFGLSPITMYKSKLRRAQREELVKLRAQAEKRRR